MFERNHQDLRYHERNPEKKKAPPHHAPGDFEATEDELEPGAVAVSGISKPLDVESKAPALKRAKKP